MSRFDELDLLEQAQADAEQVAEEMGFTNDVDRRKFVFMSLATAAASCARSRARSAASCARSRARFDTSLARLRAASFAAAAASEAWDAALDAALLAFFVFISDTVDLLLMISTQHFP